MEKITVRTNPKCMFCLGSGISRAPYDGVTMTCSCVTEQLKIIVIDKDYTIQDRYRPGKPEYVKE